MTYRDSFISTTSSDTYPSTMSTLSSSALGLTDSPLRPRLRSTVPSTPSTPSSSIPGTPIRTRPSQPQLRQAASRNSLHQEATTNAARKVVQQQSSEALRTVPPKSSQTNLQGGNGTTGNRPASRVGSAISSTGTPPRPATTSPAQTNPRTTPTRTTPSNSVPRPTQVQRPQTTAPPARVETNRPPSNQPSPVRRKPVPVSPARTETTLAEEWETELIKDTRQLNIRPAPPAPVAQRQGPTAKEKEEQRLKDMEWERSGLWETARDPVREAEDRARRDVGRDVAYPPATPRVPVRAAPTGVTSIHIGVRPRLHPTRASDSMIRNQPDPTVPIPLFSPASASADLPGESVRGKYDSNYDPAKAEKARKEFEDWKARKAEREGGIADEGENYGSRDWVPKDREVARPGNVEGIAHSEAYEDHHHRRTNADQLLLDQQMQVMQQQAMQQQAMQQQAIQQQAIQSMQKVDNTPTVKAVKQQQIPQAVKSQPGGQTDIDNNQIQSAEEMQAQAHYQAQNWGYPYPYGMGYEGMGMQGMEGYYPDQAYWDPSYWWGIYTGMADPQQMAMGQVDNNDGGKKVQFLDPNLNSGSTHGDSPQQVASTPVTPEDLYADM